MGIKWAAYQQTILQVIDLKQNYFSFEEIQSVISDSASPLLRRETGEAESIARPRRYLIRPLAWASIV
jgi:hypothetical protein